MVSVAGDAASAEAAQQKNSKVTARFFADRAMVVPWGPCNRPEGSRDPAIVGGNEWKRKMTFGRGTCGTVMVGLLRNQRASLEIV